MLFLNYFMAADTTGNDLRQIVEFSSAYFKQGISPFTGANNYPPFTTIFFAPLMFFSQFTNYIIVTALTLILYSFYLIFFPIKFSIRKKINKIFLLFLITGFISYGFQFELERGQFNIIAIFLCVIAVYLFHFKPKYRLIAYILFTFSVQLKIYPAIFILMFIEDWNLWKENLKRILLLVAINVLFLFILGFNIFSDFIYFVFHFSANPTAWTGNHSISSFIILITEKSVERLGTTGISWMSNYSALMKYLLLLIFLLILTTVIFRIIKKKEKGFSKKLFFVCMIGALIIPPISHDYKLALLALPTALMFDDLKNRISSSLNTLLKFLIISASFFYSSTLFSYTNKPVYLSNNFPFIFLLLISMLILDFLAEKRESIPK
jgi:hypothetical protein